MNYSVPIGTKLVAYYRKLREYYYAKKLIKTLVKLEIISKQEAAILFNKLKKLEEKTKVKIDKTYIK